ncbi:MAG: 30S ribosomal protein S2 [Candidatus Omnitrophica bacterium]|nr:30S ribosomal protein S2 [Candidatus Omnitrophota bacterium]
MAVSIKQLLESGVHFGHQTRRWNPKMARYIFGERNGIYIINLERTEKELKGACDFLNEIASTGGYVLFVGTKKQAQQAIVDEANRCEMYYVDQRWLGGTLTNFETIRKSIKRLDKLETMRDDGTFDKLKKKEVAVYTKEMLKLLKNLGGIRTMDKLPSALFIIDIKKEETAVKEARRLKIPIVALVDTNSDPDVIDFVIPGNDDAIKSVRLVAAAISEAIIEGRSNYVKTRKTEAPAPKQATKEAKADEVKTADKEPTVKKKAEKAKKVTSVAKKKTPKAKGKE